MTDLKPCRFCGETKKLWIDEGVVEILWALDAAGEVLRGPTGEPTDIRVESERHLHHIDLVRCDVCEAEAPLRVWNSTPEWMGQAVANMKAADAEYDDDGVWQGRVAEIAA